MALNDIQQARLDAINAQLRDPKASLTKVDRLALCDEANAILAGDTKAPVDADRTAALTRRADTLSAALYDRDWSGPDRGLIGRALSETMEQLTAAGGYNVPTRTAPASRPNAVLNPALADRLGDRHATGDARDAAIGELATALAPPPAA